VLLSPFNIELALAGSAAPDRSVISCFGHWPRDDDDSHHVSLAVVWSLVLELWDVRMGWRLSLMPTEIMPIQGRSSLHNPCILHPGKRRRSHMARWGTCPISNSWGI